MAKARTGAAGKGKPDAKARKKDKPEKKTAEQLSDMDRQKLLFKHKNKLKPLLVAKKAAGDAVSKAYELAKKDGVPKKEIEFAIICETGEGVVETNMHLEMMQRVARWSGVGKQLELFGGKDDLTKQERVYEDGRIAALNDLPAKPPEHLAQKDAQTWLSGHAAGRTSLNTQRATTGFKPIGDAVTDLAEKAGISGVVNGSPPPVEHQQAA
jgi:hypothetical protein